MYIEILRSRRMLVDGHCKIRLMSVQSFHHQQVLHIIDDKQMLLLLQATILTEHLLQHLETGRRSTEAIPDAPHYVHNVVLVGAKLVEE